MGRALLQKGGAQQCAEQNSSKLKGQKSWKARRLGSDKAQSSKLKGERSKGKKAGKLGS
jgi:hypothetical protein